MPDRVYFEPEALKYDLGRDLKARFELEGVPILMTTSHNRVTDIPGDTPQAMYRNAKRTLVVGVKKSMSLDVCRPSADFEFSIASGCPGGCEYCYLATTMGRKPYVRVYVNVEEILDSVQRYIERRKPEVTVFEAASTSDPLAVEHLTGSLAKAIVFFAGQKYARLRFVTKQSNVDSLLDLHHRGHTKFRFSINSRYVIRSFEHNTASFDERLNAVQKVYGANYPMGFVIAPIMVYDGWEDEYLELLESLGERLGQDLVEDLTFELIQFRFTPASKKVIQERFKGTKLDLDETTRRPKYGKYGRVKWIYREEESSRIERFFRDQIGRLFPSSVIEYFT